MQDLITVGVADAGDEGLVLEQVLELAGVAPNPSLPDSQGEGRVVGIRAQVGVQTGDRPLDSFRSEIDLAHLGRVAVANLDRAVIGGQPAASLRPWRGVARGPSYPRAQAEDQRSLRRQLRARRGEL